MSVKKKEKVDLSQEKIKPEKKKTSSKKGSKEKQKINELKQKLVQGEDRHLRLVAEFDNFRRRKEKEITQMLQYEGKAIFEDLLSIIDDLEDRKSTRLNSSHKPISYAVFCLKKKKKHNKNTQTHTHTRDA